MEADHVADQVMRRGFTNVPSTGPAQVQRKCAACQKAAQEAATPPPPQIRRKCAHCEEEEKVPQQKSDTLFSGGQSLHSEGLPLVHQVLSSPGQPLTAPDLSFFHSRFRFDFSRVRIHTDRTAAESARFVNALAYTSGSDIAFAANRYQPGTEAGRGLIAHELAHVVQQSRSGQARIFRKVTDDPLTVQLTQGSVDGLTDPELDAQIRLLQSFLRDHAGDAAVGANLALLESTAYRRQVTAEQPAAPAATAAPAPANTVASQATGTGRPAPFPSAAAALSRTQIEQIMAQATSLDDLKLRLGLGVVSNERLSEFLLEKGFRAPGPEKEFVYDGPTVSKTPRSKRVFTRKILYTDPEGGTVSREASGTEAQLKELQDDANLDAAISMGKGLATAAAGIAGGRAATSAVTNSAENQPKRSQSQVIRSQANAGAGPAPVKPAATSADAPPATTPPVTASPATAPPTPTPPQAVPNQPLLLNPAGNTSRTLNQVRGARGTNRDRGTAAENYKAELSRGSTDKKADNTPLGKRFHDVRDEPSEPGTVFRREVKNFRRFLTRDGKTVRNFVPVTRDIQNEILKDKLWIREGAKTGERRVVQWDFVGAPPNEDLEDLLQRVGLPYASQPFDDVTIIQQN
jgi:hypothetical protein